MSKEVEPRFGRSGACQGLTRKVETLTILSNNSALDICGPGIRRKNTALIISDFIMTFPYNFFFYNHCKAFFKACQMILVLKEEFSVRAVSPAGERSEIASVEIDNPDAAE